MFKLPLRLMGLAVCCLLFPASAYADPIRIGFGENVSAFSFTLVGSAVNPGVMYGFPLGTSWEVSFAIEEAEGASDGDALDLLRVTSTARHVVAPHQEPPSDFVF
jgi:hypothetical protein